MITVFSLFIFLGSVYLQSLKWRHWQLIR